MKKSEKLYKTKTSAVCTRCMHTEIPAPRSNDDLRCIKCGSRMVRKIDRVPNYNPTPKKGESRLINGSTFYYIGKTEYWSKALLVKEYLKEKGLGVAITGNKTKKLPTTKQRHSGIYYYIWATKFVFVPMMETGGSDLFMQGEYNPTQSQWKAAELRLKADSLMKAADNMKETPGEINWNRTAIILKAKEMLRVADKIDPRKKVRK